MTASPAAIIQRQLDAYNARELETLLQIYADEAELYEFPATLLARGTAALRERFATRFREPNLHAALLHRIVAGDTVIDHERVTRTFPEGPGTIELTMIYQVQHGRIVRAWSIAGPKTLAGD
ncbi:steroid delta-isomerase [Oleiharenicola lentus]|uniref:Steroid delta-isomerase n=2 Tax=Oleiharenicola lentus TaxID=2508720 RepID=A0A4Q1CCY3_9BACT|nr:steroid delta-isomerase [Oleiharenicola lentus]